MIEFPGSGSPLALFARVIEERVEKTIKKLVNLHNNGVLTPEEAHSGIATIAGLRLALSDVKEKLEKPQLN
mgnify:FL=1